LQTGLAYIFADTIESMQRLDMQEVPGLGLGFGWYGKETAYSSYILTGSDEYPDNLDWMQTNGIYTGPLNDYDKSLEWMVGGCEGHADIKCIKDTGSRKTYGLSVTVSDRFDFSIANTSGFKQLLSGIGMLLFREFEWSCTVNFEITTAYSYDHCSHGSGAYRWTYDADNFAMNSDDSEDFIRNNTTHKINVNAKGEAFHYYELDKTVRLYHDKPWVLEYDTVRPKRIAFAPVENAQAKTYPLISQSSNQHLYIVSKEYAMALGQNGSEDRYYAYDYYGTKLLKPYDYNYNKPHTFRLENIISGDGSNIRSSYADAFKSVSFTLACNESLKTRRPVKVELE